MDEPGWCRFVICTSWHWICDPEAQNPTLYVYLNNIYCNNTSLHMVNSGL